MQEWPHYSCRQELLRPIRLVQGGSDGKTRCALPLQKKVTITGVVKDALGPVVGANVVEKGTTNGTVTDMEGRFSLQVSSNAVLIISYIGYIDQAIPVNGKSSFTVLLKEDSQALDEVVVVGYGTQKKEVVTAAITTVKASDIAVSPSADVAAGLAGRLSGVIINTRSGEVGNEGTSIFVRGKSTYASGTEPLYVVDGIARTEEDRILSRMDPNDIESISVLKDAFCRHLWFKEQQTVSS